MSPTESDACATCSGSFDDIISAIKCNECEKYFHSGCEGMPALRGFNIRRATWKCRKCSKSDPTPLEADLRKRHHSLNDDVVLINASDLTYLLDTVKKLSETVGDMKQRMDEIYEQNKSLMKNLPSSLTTDKTVSSAPAKVSYSSITQRQGKKPATSKSVNTETADNNNTPAGSLSQPSLMQTNANSINTELSFTPAKPRRKRSMKPLLIGSATSSATTEVDGGPAFTGSERRQWIYVGRVSGDTSADVIANYVKSTWKITDVKCVPLAQNDDFRSYKVGVRESHLTSLLDATKWPKLVAVREFVHFPRSSSKSGNFRTEPAESAAP